MSLHQDDFEPLVRADVPGDGETSAPVSGTTRMTEATRAPATAGTRRRRWLATALVVTLAAVAAGALAVTRSSTSPSGSGERAGATAPGTAKVTRQDLVSRIDVDGTLGYSGSRTVLGQRHGTVTALPQEGTVIERGQSLYSVDNQPIALLYGDVPAWRDMSIGMVDGPDVRQLEENLVALGHATPDEVTVDEHFTSATAAAVRSWQRALGVEQTGRVALGDAVFLPGALRVASVKAEKGASSPLGSPVLSGTSTSRIVHVDLDPAKQSLVKVGDKVEVKLPGGATTPGTVSSVGTVATAKGQGENAKQVIAVSVTLDDSKATGTIDQAPVRVGITSDSRKAVLAVPVNALLALSEGGYGVRVVTGSSTATAAGATGTAGRRIVAVSTGLFSRGMVEISGDGIEEGTSVEVPAS